MTQAFKYTLEGLKC